MQKVMDGSNALAARIWQDLCGDDSTEPDECDTVVLSTFLKLYEEEVKRLQGTGGENDFGHGPEELHWRRDRRQWA